MVPFKYIIPIVNNNNNNNCCLLRDMLFTKYASVETTSDSIDKVAVHAAAHAGNHIGME
jgi:hypothetical protein